VKPLRCAVFADIHSNFDALTVVLDDIAREKPDAIYCVGDIVGYGAEPTKCLKAVRALGCPVVAGNHDSAVAGKMDIDFFNADALQGVMLTRGWISEDDLLYLRSLELTCLRDGVLLVHSTPADPGAFQYIFTVQEAQRALDAFDTPICFVGHSHVPVALWFDQNIVNRRAPRLDLSHVSKAIVNVGSVGQPRDRDPRAAYALFDTDTRQLEIRRLEYDWESAAHKIMQAGLPNTNAYRLALGA
jgi:diadenosine tetraphosphatase ApaH/serine/threonine PP2A family protein phosphatase